MIELATNIILPLLALLGAVFFGVRYGKKAEQKDALEGQNEALREYEKIDNSPDVADPLDQL